MSLFNKDSKQMTLSEYKKSSVSFSKQVLREEVNLLRLNVSTKNRVYYYRLSCGDDFLIKKSKQFLSSLASLIQKTTIILQA